MVWKKAELFAGNLPWKRFERFCLKYTCPPQCQRSTGSGKFCCIKNKAYGAQTGQAWKCLTGEWDFYRQFDKIDSPRPNQIIINLVSCLISRLLRVVSYSVGEIHLPARPGAARGSNTFVTHLMVGLDLASLLGGGCTPKSGAEGLAWVKGCSKGREVFPWQCTVVVAFLQTNKPDYPKSEGLCHNSKPTHFTLPSLLFQGCGSDLSRLAS